LEEFEMVHTIDAGTLPRCDVLKIDTEGSEVDILLGYPHLKSVKVLLVEPHAVNGDLIGNMAAIKTLASEAGLICTRDAKIGESFCFVSPEFANLEESEHSFPNPPTPPSPIHNPSVGPANGAVAMPTRPAQLVSVTLTKNNESTLGDALESVKDLVDHMVVIDTGSTDDTIKIAKAFGATIYHMAWPNDFAAARNAAFEFAAKYGDWGFMLDSDEQIIGDKKECRKLLLALDKIETGRKLTHITCQNSIKTEWRERIFRLPFQGKFIGPTHEWFSSGESGNETMIRRGQMTSIQFYGTPKTQKQIIANARRDATILQKYAAEHPESRWYFYLGAALITLGEIDDALDAFASCVNTPNGWNEERAFAAFKMGQIFFELGRRPEARVWADEALRLCPEMAEAAWLKGMVYTAEENWEQGKLWGHICKTILENFDQSKRQGFKFVFKDLTVTETFGADDILRVSYAGLGDMKKADHYLKLVQRYLPGLTNEMPDSETNSGEKLVPLLREVEE
jgi:tetratricopeptide (TPR) repeat protein